MTDDKQVRPKLKEVIGRMFDKAFSDDPAVACQAIGKLVTLLKIAMKQLGTTENDALLHRAMLGANRAWHEYTSVKDSGLAMQTVRAVLTEIGDFAFDPSVSSLDPDAFVGRK